MFSESRRRQKKKKSRWREPSGKSWLNISPSETMPCGRRTWCGEVVNNMIVSLEVVVSLGRQSPKTW